MGPLIQKVCLVTFLIIFVAFSSAPVADGTETERQSTCESTCELNVLNSTGWFAGCVVSWAIILLEVFFFIWYKCRKGTQNSPQQDTSSKPDEQVGSRGYTAVTDTAKDLPHKEARKYEVDVILKGKTAHSQLNISQDGKVVKWVTQKEEPQTEIDKNDIDKHFDKAPYVLGSKVRAMRAYWEVCVKDKNDWVLGVTRATAKRKGDLVLSPANGFWAIGISDGKVISAFIDDVVVLKKIILHTVGIYMDYPERKVIFYNAEDGSIIYPFPNGPRYDDDVRPLFSPLNNDTDSIRVLSIDFNKSK